MIYSAELVESFAAALAGSGRTLDVHLKIDTGMHRLGVPPAIALELAQRIRSSGVMRLTGICTHFASAEDPGSDDFTRQQIATFNQVIDQLKAAALTIFRFTLPTPPAQSVFLKRITTWCASAWASTEFIPLRPPTKSWTLNLPWALPAVSPASRSSRPATRWVTTALSPPSAATKVGIVPFGYDDGLPWRLSGTGQVLVEGRSAPIVGRISMDQMQIDLTDVPEVSVGAEVLLYGAHNGHTLRPEQVSQMAGTIPYELLTRLGERVHRIYVEP